MPSVQWRRYLLIFLATGTLACIAVFSNRNDIVRPEEQAVALAPSVAATRRPVFYRCSEVTVELSRRVGVNESDDPECCPSVANDVDHGKTLTHAITRHLCANGPRRTPVRVIQVGANTGDNANDHLVRFLKRDVAEAVLLEPVPWIFQSLQQTYQQGYESRITLVEGAMSDKKGNLSFVAPKHGVRGWEAQMGGFSLPPKSARSVSKKGHSHLFQRITVTTHTFESLLALVGWTRSGVPDVFVVDAEGHDAVIVHHVWNSVARLFGPEARVPVMQWEWKHLSASEQELLNKRAKEMGYCVRRVHYDDIATIRRAAADAVAPSCSVSFDVTPVK